MIRDGYTWDEDTNQANIEKHGISFERARLILERGNAVQNPPYERNGEERIRSIGQINGETIAVIHTEENDQTKIITAHKNRNLDAEYAAALEAQGRQLNQTFDAEFEAWGKLDRAQQANNRDDYLERQQHDQRELAAAQSDPSKDIEAIKERQRVEAIAERAPRVEHDQAERAELAASFAEVTRTATARATDQEARVPSAADIRDQREQAKLAEQHAKQLNALAARGGSEEERKSLEEKQRREQERLAKYQAERLARSRGQANELFHER